VTPTVSVVVPTYNRAATLPASLDSVLAQRGLSGEIEILVADDGSTDDTARMLARYGDKLRVLSLPHRGVAAARNAAVTAARGEYVAFHDSDDLAFPERLAVSYSYLSPRPELGAVVCNGWMGADGTTPWIAPRLARRLERNPVGLAEVFDHSLAQMQAMLFRRAALAAVGGFDESLMMLSDLDFLLRFALRWPLGFHDVPVFAYFKQADSLTASRAAVREQSIVILERFVASHPEAVARLGAGTIRSKRAHRYHSLAKHRRGRGDVRGAWEAADRAVGLAPLRIDYRVLRWRLAREQRAVHTGSPAAGTPSQS
jgi:glycosyltransferase involved in cell wall biosynthesis